MMCNYLTVLLQKLARYLSVFDIFCYHAVFRAVSSESGMSFLTGWLSVVSMFVGLIRSVQKRHFTASTSTWVMWIVTTTRVRNKNTSIDGESTLPATIPTSLTMLNSGRYIYTLWPKNVTQSFLYLCEIGTNFTKFFTDTLCGHFVMKLLLNTLAHFNCVATLLVKYKCKKN